MTQPCDGPLDRQQSAAIVALTVALIDEMTTEERDALLLDLLEAAWHTVLAQNQ
jgi:hypothetical protein